MTINLIINNERIELNDLTFPQFEAGETVFVYDETGAQKQYKVHNIVKSFRKSGGQVDGGLEIYLG